MSTHRRDVEDARGDLVGVLYLCSAGCYRDSFELPGAAGADKGGEAPCSVPEYEDGGSFVYCASCGVRLNGPDAPVVVNLIGRDVDETTGLAVPVRDSGQIEHEARQAGAEHGKAAASWYFDGNTSDETYAAVVRGIEEGDPAVLDTFPSGPLSGEWADDPTPRSVLEELDVDAEDESQDEYLQAYEDGFYEASSDEIERVARLQVFTVEPYAWPGGYPIAYVMDDGDVLCARCVRDPSNPLHLSGEADGWRLEGSQVLEGSEEDHDGPVHCSHCNRTLLSDSDES
jgi:hypothetical protein